MTFLDFGLVKRWTPGEWERLEPSLDAIVVHRDPDLLVAAMEQSGFLADGHGLDPAAVYDYVSSPYRPYLVDEFTFTRDWMRDTLGRIFDINGPHAAVIAKLNMPPSFVILDRVVWGVSAILGKLDVPTRGGRCCSSTARRPAGDRARRRRGGLARQRRERRSRARHLPPTVAAGAWPGSHEALRRQRHRARRRRGRRPGRARRSCSCHGFPESAHSWRHQIEPLAAAGYHVLAPDQRGYGRSSAPRDVAAYGIEHLCGDLLGLLDATGHDDAVFVGHDWGALLVWDLARLHPDRVRAVVNVSVPYTEWPAPPTDVFKAASGDRFFYILYFQGSARPRPRWSADVERTMRTVLWAASGDGFQADPPTPPPAAGTGWLDVMGARPPPAELPAWLTEADLAAYVDAFEASGFFGPVSWYRNLDHNHALVKDRPAPAMPVWFIGGTRDGVIAYRPGYVEAMAARLPDLRGTDADRGRRALDPAGGAGGVQPGAAGGAGRAGRGTPPRRRAERPHAPAAATRGRRPCARGGQLPSRLYAHHSNGLR